MRIAIWTAVAAIFAFAILLALPLIREGFWCDEGFSIVIAQAHSAGEFLHDIRVCDPHPPLFNTLLAGWGRLVGWNELSIKLFALIWGLLSIAGIMAAAWQIAGRTAGVLAGAIALHSPLVTAHLAEARGYSMSLALVASGIAFLWAGLQPDAARSKRRVACVILALACWSHYIALAAVTLCGALAYGFTLWRKSEFWGRAARVNLVAAATTLPLAGLMLGYARTGLPREHIPSLREGAAVALRKIAFALPHADFSSGMAGPLALVLLAIGALFVLPSLATVVRERANGIALLACYAVPVLAIFGPLGAPERYVLIGAGLICVAAAVMFTVLDEAAGARPRVRLIVRAAMAGFMVISLGSLASHAGDIVSIARTATKSGGRSLARMAHFTGDDIILIEPDTIAPTIAYYSGHEPLLVGFPQWNKPEITEMAQQHALWTRAGAAEETAARLDALVRERHPKRVFFIDIEPSDRPELGELQRAIARRWSVAPMGRFHGRVESMDAYLLESRGSG